MTLILVSTLLAVAQTASPPAGAMPAPDFVEKQSRPSADEPTAAQFSLRRAAAQMDTAALSWTRQHKCGSCHTNYPYLMARPLLREFASPAENEVRAFFENRVAHWDDPAKAAKPRWDAEVISTASVLAFHDAAATGKLHPLTRQALDRIWTLQKSHGGWEWLKCGWPPLEHDDYYGAIVVALGVGHAPGDYAHSASARPGLERLRGFFRKTPPPDMHHQAMLLWAATRLDGLMDSDQRAATIRSLRALQRADGGWCLPSLGQWKRRDGEPNNPASASDGYATGLVVFVLREAGVAADDPAIQRGITWLKSHQRASGRWFTRSLNDDEAHYITNAGSCLAVMALWRCAEAGEPKLTQAVQEPRTR